MMAAFDTLATLLGPRFATSDAARAQNGRNEAHFPEALPDAVAYPQTTAEVAAIVAACAAEGIPVTAIGAGTSLEGQHLAVGGAGGGRVGLPRPRRARRIRRPGPLPEREAAHSFWLFLLFWAGKRLRLPSRCSSCWRTWRCEARAALMRLSSTMR